MHSWTLQGVMGWHSNPHSGQPLRLATVLFLYFEPKKYDTYLFFDDMQQQILDVQVLVLLGMSCLLIFVMVLNAILSFSCICT